MTAGSGTDTRYGRAPKRRADRGASASRNLAIVLDGLRKPGQGWRTGRREAMNIEFGRTESEGLTQIACCKAEGG